MKKKVERFMETLEEYGEIYFTSGNYKEDYENIKSIITRQGYYSGCQYRFYFNEDLELTSLESRF